ncbi:PaRep2b protein [Pyrobaculum aerophilum]|nr:PaRep2b protein [Pyrobaculum aerophilum]
MLPTLHKLRDALAEFADAFRVVTREVSVPPCRPVRRLAQVQTVERRH